ncbi:helix-turn-helix domain-containing protein [Paenibacillus sp. FSL H3-0333]|uniref:helix-turn-helix domain-containing protein n=1 Tax=Paenibacillus sp. FSL H3-0333 TaxID=2921373 RepID=UPI0030F7D6E1
MDITELRQKLDDIMSQLMTTEEAGELWGLSQVRVKDLCAAEQIIAAKRGKTWLILKGQDNPKQRERNSK